MNILDICQREVVSISGRATVREAAQMMRDRHVGSIVVTDPEEPGRVMGMLTDRDLVLRLLAQGLPAEGQAVGPLCHGELAGVAGSATVQDAVEAMHTAGVRRLLVTQADGGIAGIVSMDDILDALALEVEALAGALRSGIARESARPRGAASVQPPRAMYITRNEP